MPRATRRDALLIFVALLAAYLYVLPRWADWSQNSRLNLVRALVEERTTVIDDYVSNTGDYAIYNDHTYTDKPPGLSFVALPFYAAALPVIDHPSVRPLLAKLAGGGAMGGTLNRAGTGLNDDKIRHFVAQALLTALTVALPAAALGVLLFSLLLRLGHSRAVALAVTLAYALATPAAAYAGNFYSHQFVAALLFGAFALLAAAEVPAETAPAGAGILARLSRGRARLGAARAFLFGLLCSFAVISEYPIALIIAALGVYALVRLRPADLLAAALGALPPVALMAVYDVAAFGTPLPVGYEHSALWQNQHQTGFMSVTYPHPEALWGLLFGSFRGLFFRAPWLLIAIPGFVIWWRSGARRGLWGICLAASVLLTLFYSSSVMWWGGFGIGPRYLVPMLPFLAVPAAAAAQVLWKTSPGRGILTALVVLSGGLVWVEAVAGQSFPTDAMRQPWVEYTFPAWQSGDIARNLGTALGLHGPLSLLPLALLLAVLVMLLVRPPALSAPGRPSDTATRPAETLPANPQ